jgi:hypothetical protein
MILSPQVRSEYPVDDMVSNRNMIVTALATQRRLTLSSICAHHRVMWVANEIERGQIQEYAETLHFSGNKRLRTRCCA